MFTAEQLRQLCPHAHTDIVDAVAPTLGEFASALYTEARRVHLKRNATVVLGQTIDGNF